MQVPNWMRRHVSGKYYKPIELGQERNMNEGTRNWAQEIVRGVVDLKKRRN